MIKQRDIILIPFPFSDLSTSKVRPALVISNNTYNQSSPDVVVIAITSNILPRTYKVFFDNHDMEAGSMPIKSAIRTDKPFSTQKINVLKIMGTLNTRKFEEVIFSITQLLLM